MSSKLKLINIENLTKAIPLGFRLFKAQLLHVPLAVNYDITWRCNLRCNHCYFFSSTEELSYDIMKEWNELTDEQWIRVFKYHRELGTRSAALTGGEPTLRMNLIQEAIKIFPSVQIASNGIIKLPMFKTYKQPIYWVSLDGGEKTHNSIRGANIFHKVIKNIQNDKRVLVSTTLSSMNYKEIEKIVKIAYEVGVSGIFFLFYTGYPEDTLLLKGEILRATTKLILKVMQEYGDFILISKKILELFITKEFTAHCLFKLDDVRSYYPNGKRKFCVMGNSQKLCANCGCIVAAAAYALSKFDPETVDKLKKFPF